ncbi:hypothetical protein RQP46_003411 [Phenoliferia psychrophenolica]
MEIEPSLPADVEIEWEQSGATEEEDVMVDDSGIEGDVDAEMGEEGETSGIVDAVLGGTESDWPTATGDDEELPDSQAGDLDRNKALASQSQHSSDGSLTQEQVVENTGDHETRVVQRQSQERDSLGEGAAVQENEVVIHQETDDESGKERVEIEMHQTNSGSNSDSGAPVQQVNHVKVINRGEDCASCTHSGGTMSRPAISKDLLAVVDLDPLFEPTTPTVTGDEDDTGAEEADDDARPRLIAPTVLLSLNGKTYSVFQRLVVDGLDPDSTRPELDAALPVLFEEPAAHELYYDQLESFIEALHDVFPELSGRQDEIVLSFEAIGITLPEDNVYTREVCLFDFDRVHVGCGLPGRLHITLESQARFSTGFNALAQHIANTYAPTEDSYLDEALDAPEPTTTADIAAEEPEEEASAPIENAEDEASAAAAEPTAEEGEQFEDGEWAGVDESAYHDATAAVAEFEEGVGEAEEEGEPSAAVEEGVEEEQNYEGLDDADLAAAIEGAQEDFVLSETSAPPAEGEGEGEEYVDAEFGDDEATTAGEGSGDATHDDDHGEPSAEHEPPRLFEDAEEGDSFSTPVPPEIHIDATGLVAGAAEHEGADEEDGGADDVVIDYEEVFDTSAVPSPAAAPPADLLPEAPMSPTPKRSHDDLHSEALDGGVPPDEHASSAAKRARMDDPTSLPPPEPTPAA